MPVRGKLLSFHRFIVSSFLFLVTVQIGCIDHVGVQKLGFKNKDIKQKERERIGALFERKQQERYI